MPPNSLEYRADRLLQFDFGWVEKRIRLVRVFRAGSQLEDLDPLERPAMRLGGGAKLVRRLRERDVQATFAARSPGEKELNGERRLPAPGFAVDQVETVGREPAAKNCVQTGNSGCNARRAGCGRMACVVWHA